MYTAAEAGVLKTKQEVRGPLVTLESWTSKATLKRRRRKRQKSLRQIQTLAHAHIYTDSWVVGLDVVMPSLVIR